MMVKSLEGRVLLFYSHKVVVADMSGGILVLEVGVLPRCAYCLETGGESI